MFPAFGLHVSARPGPQHPVALTREEMHLRPATDSVAAGRDMHRLQGGVTMQTVRVLIVDDESQVRSLICGVLRRDGVRTLAAGDGREALEILRASDGGIDVVISDLRMPRMDGDALIQVLRREFPSIRVLLLSSETDRPDLPWCEAVMRKPFVPAELAAAVRSLLADRGVT
jgi:two-component system, cell cycle response regulator CpdR